MNDFSHHGAWLSRLPPSLYKQVKSFLQYLSPRSTPPKILFIVGCQRSGTTLMIDLLDKDPRVKTYREFSKLSSDCPHKIRLNSLEAVAQVLGKDRAPIIVLKPLVESQNILQLLDRFSGSRALWVYRDYAEVALSNLRKFGIENGINNLKPIVENRRDNWRCEGVTEEVRQAVLEHFSEDMDPFDAAVLFWCVRNQLFFDLRLEEDRRILMCKYQDLVASPDSAIRKLYANLGEPFPGPWMLRDVHSESVRKAAQAPSSREIAALARDLLRKLDDTREKKGCGSRS